MQHFLFWQLLCLLVVHYFGDFVFQSHWMASNKSKSNRALGAHVMAYTLTLLVWCSAILFMLYGEPYFSVLAFVALNGAIHFAVDWITSRHSAGFFGAAIFDTMAEARFRANYGQPPDHAMGINPGRYWHNFFLVIGYDQLLHGLTLGLTLWVFFG